MRIRRLLGVTAALLVSAVAVYAEPGWGCYVDRWQLEHPDRWDAYCRHMASLGMNTFAFFPKSEADLIDQVETGLQTGLLRRDVPVILISNLPGERTGMTNEEEWAAMPARLAKARRAAPHGQQWPEVYLYGTDEPQREEQVLSWTTSYRAGGAKGLTSICYPNVPDFVRHLDGIMIHASPGVLTAENVAAAQAKCDLVGVYNIGMRRPSMALMRYWSGAWFYASGLQMQLMWWYPDLIYDRFPHEGTSQQWPGPMGRQMCVAYRQGVADYHRLAREGRRLPPVDWDFWPGMATGSDEVRAGWKDGWIQYARVAKVPWLLPWPERGE